MEILSPKFEIQQNMLLMTQNKVHYPFLRKKKFKVDIYKKQDENYQLKTERNNGYTIDAEGNKCLARLRVLKKSSPNYKLHPSNLACI
jgi:hypothetical protein